VQLVERRSHVRHLEYRELLAYVVREAEFADPVLRKEAARHIVDCAQCAERLRTIHVRQTAGTGTAAVEEPEETAAAPAPPVARPAARRATAEVRPLAPPAPPVPPAIQRAAAAAPAHVERPFADRRGGRERRGGGERRGPERRTSPDRRRTVSLTPPKVERRQAPRRAVDRRLPPSRDRRVSEPVPRPGEAAATAGPPAIRPEPQRGELAPRRDVEQVSGAEHGDNGTGRVAASAEAAAAASSSAQPAAEAPVGAPSAPPGAAMPPAPAAGTPPVEAIDLRWLVTPDQSLEMMRGARDQARAAAGGSGAAVPQTRSTDAPGTKPPVERRATTAAVRAAAGPPAPDAGAARAEPRRLERFRAGGEVGTADSGKTSTHHQAFPVRSLAIAAVIACVAFIGYVAGQITRGGRPGRLGLAADANAEAQSVTQTGARPAPAPTAPAPAAPAAVVTPPPPSHPAQVEHGAPPTRAPRPVATRTPAPAPRPAPVAAQPAPPAPPPAPTTGVVRGVVRDAAGGTVGGARVTVRGTALSAVADGSGAFEIPDVPAGQVALQASADGYVPGGAQAQASAGGSVSADISLSRVQRPTASCDADRELAAGGWTPIDRAAATSTLGGTLGAIQGLSIESITASTSGPRTRVRIAQLTSTCDRVVLTETRAGANVRGGSGPAVVTALRIMPASEAYPYSTGSASFGNILVTVKTSLTADALRPLLGRLSEISEGQ